MLWSNDNRDKRINPCTTKSVVKSAWILALTICLFLTSLNTVQSEEPKAGTVSILFENDIFYNADRHYTNGVSISWVSSPRSTPEWLSNAAHHIPWFPKEGDMRAIYSFGQNMYTPQDITLRNPPPDSRPYVGWLYGTIGISSETGKQLDRVAITLGIVGPSSLAEQTQKTVHRITGSNKPRGWDTQLNDEPGIILFYQRSWRGFVAHTVSRFQLDITPQVGATLGNIFTYGNTGLMMRVGKNLPLDYGPPRIQPGIIGSSFFVPQGSFGWYLFAGAEGRIVARNIFLDGNTFRSSRSVTREVFVGDLQCGIVLTWPAFRISYTHVLRTHEFRHQHDKDRFGAVSVSIPF